MSSKRKQPIAKFKAKVALEAAKGLKTSGQLSSEFKVSSSQISTWKKQLLDNITQLFERNKQQTAVDEDALTAPLYQEIGRLKVERDGLKKTRMQPILAKRAWVDRMHASLTISRQCELLALPRSSFYYPPAQAKKEDLEFMKLIDQLYTKYPFFGSRRITSHLKVQGHNVNRKRVQRYMNIMGVQGVAPGPNTSVPHPEHKIYPYLLRNVPIERVNQVWSTDITYIPMPVGFMYLVAIIDGYSRYVLSWELSNTLDADFCITALHRALEGSSGQFTPEMFNSDQGCQFTSLPFTEVLLSKGIQISMDGRGRALDNIFIERLWRTVKYENIYLNDYRSVTALSRGLAEYFRFYNEYRLHQSLADQTPATVYFENSSSSKIQPVMVG